MPLSLAFARARRDHGAMRALFPIAVMLAALVAPVSVAALDQPADQPADKARAREIRTLEKDIAKLEKRYDKLIKRCQGDEYNRPDARACDNARVIYQDVQQLKKRIFTLAQENAT